VVQNSQQQAEQQQRRAEGARGQGAAGLLGEPFGQGKRRYGQDFIREEDVLLSGVARSSTR
jgi:hypothetical protein